MSAITAARDKIVQIWKNKEIRDKIWFSVAIIVVFRFLAAVPVPGIPVDSLKQLFGESQFGEVLSMVSGGVLENATIVAIGLAPYINASVIFQLLGSVIPKIEELQKEGQQGRKKINMYTRLLTVPLAILQSFVIYSVLKQYGIITDLATLDLVNLVITLTAGAIVMMWMGELVSEQGIGGGTSLLIAAGIFAGIPGSLQANTNLMTSSEIVFLGVSLLILVLFVIFVTQAERRVPIQYARRVRAMGPTAESHIPLKLNQSGVMPVIFASSLLSFPLLITQFLTGPNIPDRIQEVSTWITTQLNDRTVYNSLLFIFIVFFSFFYTFVVFNPNNVSENLQKQGAFVPGVRPGKPTAKHLTKVASRLAILGAIFLAVIGVLPSVAVELGLVSRTIISGTGLLIVVGVVLDMKRQIESMVVTRSYESYL